MPFAPDTELVDSLVGAIESEMVLYDDKVDYLYFLAELVKTGQSDQAESIANHAVHWLTHGIRGRSVGPNIGGPLSSAQLFLTRPESLHESLFHLIEKSAIRCAAAVFPKLFEWLPLNAPQHVPKHAFCLLGTCFALCTVASQDSEQSAAILVGLSETIAYLSLATDATEVVLAFDAVILQARIAETTSSISEQQLWCQTLLKQWEHRLKNLAQHSKVKVRQCVANAVRHWIESGLPSDEVAEVRNQLAADCRMRVRKAIAETEHV